MKPAIEGISAITLHVSNMQASVRFYRDLLGLELLYGGERSGFSSLRADDSGSVILNLEHGHVVPRWGRIIFHVADVDAFWSHLKGNGFDPEIPRDAAWANAISTFSIQTATNCRLLDRYQQFAKGILIDRGAGLGCCRPMTCLRSFESRTKAGVETTEEHFVVKFSVCTKRDSATRGAESRTNCLSANPWWGFFQVFRNP